MLDHNSVMIILSGFTLPNGEQSIPLFGSGRDYAESIEDIERSGRTANGKLRRDIIATKKVITLSYSEMDDALYIRLQELHKVLQGKPIVVGVRHRGRVHDAKWMYLSPVFGKRLSIIGPGTLEVGGLWQNVTITFTEV